MNDSFCILLSRLRVCFVIPGVPEEDVRSGVVSTFLLALFLLPVSVEAVFDTYSRRPPL